MTAQEPRAAPGGLERFLEAGASGPADMATAEPEMLPGDVVPASPVERPREETRTRRLPPHAVILHNDDVNGFDFVVSSLRKVFRYGRLKAYWLTLRAHATGRCAVWTGSLEVAELKAEQLQSCGPDPSARRKGAGRLRVTVEKLPG